MARPMIDDPFGGRSVSEWIGTSPDAKVPGAIKDRIFARAKGICYLANRKIMAGEPWDLEHVKPLSMGGEHRESNLRPALRDKHKAKTAEEAGSRAKANAARRAMNGTREQTTRPLQSAPFAKTDKAAARAEKAAGKAQPPRKSLFWTPGHSTGEGT